jgi:hypothetical protein
VEHDLEVARAAVLGRVDAEGDQLVPALQVGVDTRTSCARSTPEVSSAKASTLRLAFEALPERRQAWTTSRSPAIAYPVATSRPPRWAEPATTWPVSASSTATSQSPPEALRRAVTAPADGIVTLSWA